MIILSLLMTFKMLQCSENQSSGKQIPTGPLPMTPPRDIPQAPWVKEIRDADLARYFHLKSVEKAGLKDREERAEEMRKRLDDSSSDSESSDEDNAAKRMSQVTSPLDKKNNQ